MVRPLKLYNHAVAPNPRRVRIFAAEKGFELALEDVDVLTGQTRTPDFLAKNSLGAVPVLEVDDGSYLSESVAICRYLEGFNQNPEADAAFEIGSDLGGSIRAPAHFCGVFGHKSSYGIIPLRGHQPPKTQALGGGDGELTVLGPLARTARDRELALDVLAVPDAKTSRSLGSISASRCSSTRSRTRSPTGASACARY
jgi:hypothetical protein